MYVKYVDGLFVHFTAMRDARDTKRFLLHKSPSQTFERSH